MINFAQKIIFSSLVTTILFVSSKDLTAYEKKPAYAGYAQPSAVNGRPKTKLVTSHVKKTSKGYTRVNPYYRSK